MRTPSLLLTAATTASLLSTLVLGQEDPSPTPKPILWKEERGFIGCFNTNEGFTELRLDLLVSRGSCREGCKLKGTKFSALSDGDRCYCGNKIPPEENLELDYLKCGLPCEGYEEDACGGSGFYYVYTVAIRSNDPRIWDWNKHLQSGEGASSTVPQTQQTVTQSNTVVITLPPQSDAPKGESGGGAISKAGAAAGAVVGVVLAISIGVGVFFYLRKQKRRKVEEDYRRSVAVREYGKKPEADSRLDPVMLHRRMSDGSIADNEDYSRRILKVTNPDGN